MLQDIPEYKIAIREYNELRRKLNKSKRDIERLNKKYQFIQNIFSKGSGDKFLEAQLCQLFKEVGYQIVRHLKTDNRNEDIQIEVGNRITCIEVKSVKGQTITENEIFQVLKYRNRKRQENPYKQFEGVLVLNHQNEIENPYDRILNPFDEFRKNDAVINEYGLVTTVDLFKALKMIKKGEITIQGFDEAFHRFGIVKFPNQDKV